MKKPVIHNIYEHIHPLGKAEIYVAKTEWGEVASSALIVWDSTCAYNLFAAAHPRYRSTGAMSLLLWEVFKNFSGIVPSINLTGRFPKDE